MANAQDFLQLPLEVVQRDGPFQEFKQDAAILSVELADGRLFKHIVLLYPNYIVAMQGETVLPFDPRHVIRAYQSPEDLKLRSSSSWTFWPHPYSL